MSDNGFNFDDLFGDMFGGAGGAGSVSNVLIDAQFTRLKKTSNLKLCKMKSGKFKILNYYNEVVQGPYDGVQEAKIAFIAIYEG